MRYFIQNLITGRVNSFPDLQAFLRYIASYNSYETVQDRERFSIHGRSFYRYKPTVYLPIDYRKYRPHEKNSFLTQLAMHPNDYSTHVETKARRITEDHVSYTSTLVKTQRPYYCYDEILRTIDPRHYWKEIAQILPRKHERWSYRHSHRHYRMHRSLYRYDPVPGISSACKGNSSRNIRTFQERKMAADPEIELYVNPRRTVSSLPTSWDDEGWRHRTKSWKQKKIKRQYMKHVKQPSKEKFAFPDGSPSLSIRNLLC